LIDDTNDPIQFYPATKRGWSTADIELLNRALIAEKDLRPTHLPGYNFLGPSTPVLTNLINGVLPVNEEDWIALRHDIAYLQANGSFWREFSADTRAVMEAVNQTVPTTGSVGNTTLRNGLLTKMIGNVLTLSALHDKSALSFSAGYRGFENEEMERLSIIATRLTKESLKAEDIQLVSDTKPGMKFVSTNPTFKVSSA